MSKRTSREGLARYAERLAFYRPNDAIRLALEEGAPDIGKLRLEGVAEFKRLANGTVELKFIDRIKALDFLLRLQQQEEGLPAGEGISGFLEQVAGEGET